nr:hypothetical protein [Tanacetum cinerariifolium]
MMKGSDIGIQEKNAKLFNEWEMFTSNEGESIESYYHRFLNQNQPSFNQNYLQQPMTNPEDITDPTTAMNMALALIAKAFKLNYSTPTNNNQRISSNPKNRQIAQPGMNMGQDRQMQMVGGYSECCLESKGSECWKSEWFNWCSREWKSESDWEWVEQGGETVEQHPANFEETRALYESLYQNLAIDVEKVNSVNRKLKETNADLTTELARFKNQKRCFEISQEKYDKLE